MNCSKWINYLTDMCWNGQGTRYILCLGICARLPNAFQFSTIFTNISFFSFFLPRAFVNYFVPNIIILTTLYRNLSLDSRVIAEICCEVHRNYSKTILCLLFLDEVVGSPHLEISWRMETSKFCFTNESSVAGIFCSFGTGSQL
jgi:hypothetical protein